MDGALFFIVSINIVKEYSNFYFFFFINQHKYKF